MLWSRLANVLYRVLKLWSRFVGVLHEGFRIRSRVVNVGLVFFPLGWAGLGSVLEPTRP